MPVPDHIKDPRAIYDAFFAIVRAQADLSAIQADLRDVVVRLIHACGMPDIVGDLGFSADLVAAATSALAAGRPVLADCEMVASGITRKFLPAANEIIVTLNDPRTAPSLNSWRPHDRQRRSIFGAITSMARCWCLAMRRQLCSVRSNLLVTGQGRRPFSAFQWVLLVLWKANRRSPIMRQQCHF